ncbi:MAG: endo alpha-1,4 polygalactosaminidase [Solirubrobacteraceae bacterium]
MPGLTRVATIAVLVVVVAAAHTFGGITAAPARKGPALEAGRTTPPHWRMPAPPTWYRQLQGSIDNGLPASVYDVDGFDTSAAEVARLHGEGKRVIC